ncbi:TetR/AcrR family transcriptional regulator [Nakamurella endophytica]|uniref:HTH tetR-type domain-containing protein n=1 Tax=Nakamurella endophytica TaxID=1748367 RepID=A0A917TAG1_9ACTN|nr:TetR/AcrR family transcriptional regulator [Nakamurella endophytica]GGM16297.1 hypothetical protein GCM10011594_40460 [Nakamurella endophytica]
MPRADRRPRVRLDPSARREAFLAAARTAFAGQPYEAVAMAAVARDAGASEALLYRYFPSKAALYTAVAQEAVAALQAREAAAQDGLPRHSSARDRVRAALLAYLDHIAGHPVGWESLLRPGSAAPAAAVRLRRQALEAHVERLRTLLGAARDGRDDFALWGYAGFLDGACLRWVEQGADPDLRWPLVDAALGALEGALGDWRG